MDNIQQPKKRNRRRRKNTSGSGQTGGIQVVTSRVYGINVDALLLPSGKVFEGTVTELDLRSAGADVGWLLADEIIVDLGVGVPGQFVKETIPVGA